jgi:hypothetical protein
MRIISVTVRLNRFELEDRVQVLTSQLAMNALQNNHPRAYNSLFIYTGRRSIRGTTNGTHSTEVTLVDLRIVDYCSHA